MTSSKSEVFLAVAGGLLSRGRRVRFRAEGDSMHPAIRGGEAILVGPVSPAHLKKGDIALYLSGRGITAHRVVKILAGGAAYSLEERELRSLEGNPSSAALLKRSAPQVKRSFFVLRGDTPGSADEPVEQEQILGKVVSAERDGGVIDLNSKRTKIVNTIYIYAYHIRRTISNHIRTNGEMEYRNNGMVTEKGRTGGME
jgi:hypothetical protein